MKKLFLILLAGALFVACGSATETENQKAEAPAEEKFETPAPETTTQDVAAEAEQNLKETATNATVDVAKEVINKTEEVATEAIQNAEVPVQNKSRR